MDFDNFIISTIALIILLALLAALILGVFKLDEFSCKKQAEAIDCRCEYSILTGCVLIKPDGKRVLLKTLREF